MARAKTCKACKTKFTPDRPLQSVCTPRCGLELAARKREKERQEQSRKEMQAFRARKERMKTRRDHLREVQQVFNAYIRERDRDLPCISCGRHHEGQYHAGHFRTVAASPELRFEELNCHKQCAPCNNHKSGDIVNYRINLVHRIGADKVEWLEGMHEAKRYTIAELEELKAKYRKLTRELKKAA